MCDKIIYNLPVKKFPAFIEPKAKAPYSKKLPLETVLCQFNPVNLLREFLYFYPHNLNYSSPVASTLENLEPKLVCILILLCDYVLISYQFPPLHATWVLMVSSRF